MAVVSRSDGTVPIFVSVKMGLSPSPRFASLLLLVTQESVQSHLRGTLPGLFRL